MKIRFNFDILVITIIFYLTKNLEKYSMFMIFIFLHECAHLIVGLHFGAKANKINIYALGVSLDFYSFGHIEHKYVKKILIFLAGPASNFIIATIFIIFGMQEYVEIIYINVILGIFNLLPIYPLDGGKILKEVIAIRNGDIKAEIIVNKISNFFMIILTALYSIVILLIHNFSIFMVIIYMWIMVYKENRKIKVKETIYSCIENNN